MGITMFLGSREERRADYESVELLKSLSKQTHKSYAELSELYHVFLLQHPDGVMTRSEFVRDNIAAHGGPEELWHRVFDFAALNGTDEDQQAALPVDSSQRVHHLTFAQVIFAATQNRRNATACFEKLVKRVFEFIDVQGDGFIDEAELTTVIGWLYALPETCHLRQRADVLKKFCSSAPSSSHEHAQEAHSLESLRHVYPPLVDPAARAAQIMKWMDMDEDGMICETEFIEACRGDQSFVEAFSFVAS